MIEGHGDDLYKYGKKIVSNFSSNVYNRIDHSGLYQRLNERLSTICSYPEPMHSDDTWRIFPQAHGKRIAWSPGCNHILWMTSGEGVVPVYLNILRLCSAAL